MTMLLNNYKSDLNVVDGLFENTEEQIYSFYKALNLVDKQRGDLVPNKDSEEYKEVHNNFTESMDNDFNTSSAISFLFNYVSTINKAISSKDIQKAVNYAGAIKEDYAVLGLLQQEPQKVIDEIKNKYLSNSGLTVEEIDKLVKERIEYKANKNYEEADKIRNMLSEKGIIINDRSQDIDWDINIVSNK